MKSNIKHKAFKVSHRKSKEIEKALSSVGIEKSQYRINYFSSEKELVADISLAEKIKSVLG